MPAGIDVAEFFLLREAGRLKAGVQEPQELHQALQTALQRRRAAEALWSAGHSAEALRIVHAALLDANTAAQKAADAESLAVAVQRLALDPALSERWEALTAQTLPALDVELEPEHTVWFGEALRLHSTLTTAADYATLGASGRRRKKVLRWVTTLLALLAFSAASWWLYDRSQRARVEASSFFNDNPRFAPEHATDGDPRTEWVLAARKGGWLDVYLDAPQKIRGVKLLNGHNPPHNDRAVRAFRVVAFNEDGEQKSVQSAFTEFTDSPQWKTIGLKMDDVVRVRLEVHNYFRKGGCLAEIKVLR